MKLKLVHQNQDSNRGGGQEQVMKKEAMKMGMEEADIDVPPAQDSVKEDSAEPASDSHPLLVSGKRNRKPKELIDEVSSIIMRKRKKSSSSMKSTNGTPDTGGTSRSIKGVANGGGSGTPIQMKPPTMIQAEEFLLSLGNDQPSFVKMLVRSHVGSCFWMGLPVPFCKLHLPDKDTEVILENENGEEFSIKYIANKTGLSAGWRKFVAGNRLVEGDALVFQLTGTCRLKVYTIRANNLTEVDGALSLLILDSQTKKNDAEVATDAQIKKKRRPKSLPLTVLQKKKRKAGQVGTQFGLPEEQSGNDSDEVASEVLEGAKFSGSSSNFKDVKNLEEFHVMVNGVCIDSDLPEDIRRKYYELCCTKDSFLHDRLLPGLCSKLAAGMIVETINIVDFIRGCKLTTPRREFEVWEKSLRSFELLGLNVGFLRSRVHQLLKLAFETEDGSEIRRYWEVQEEQRRTTDEIHKLEAKLAELREFSAKCDHKTENLRIKAESYVAKFQEEVDAPW